MYGLIATYGSKIVFVIGQTMEDAENTVFELFMQVGIDLTGVEISMITFDPSRPLGMLLDPKQEDVSMEGWGADGWTGT